MKGSVCVVGSFMMDLVATVARRPAPGETLAGTSFAVHLGGKGYNQAVAARRYGADVSFVGMLGKDDFGDRFAEGLATEGIDHHAVGRHPEDGTGVGLPVVEETGENSIIIIPRANLSMRPEDVRAAAATITACDVLLLQLELSMDTTIEAARIAHDAGVNVVLNPAPFVPLPAELMASTDILVPNEGEARALAQLGSSASTTQIVSTLRRQWPSDLVVTLGSAGVLVCTDEDETMIAAHVVPSVDTVGAGDTFCGVLGAELAAGASLVRATTVANAAAAIAVTREGGSTAAPDHDEVHALMAGAASAVLP